MYVDGGFGAAGAGVGLACVRLLDAAAVFRCIDDCPRSRSGVAHHNRPGSGEPGASERLATFVREANAEQSEPVAGQAND